jgi:hypothetical protein
VADRVADLIVRLKADTAQLDRALSRSERQVKTSADRMRAALGGLRTGLLAVGAAAAAGGAALAALAKGALESADNLGKSADRIGINTEELQRLQFAADLAGVSQEKLGKTLEVFGRRTAEARVGTGDMITTLKRLDEELFSNIVAADSAEERFLLVADAISNTTDEAKRLAIANAVGGRSASGLINLWAQGRDVIKELGDEFTRFGGVLTREAAARAEEVNDAFLRLATFFRQQFTVALLDAKGGTEDLAAALNSDDMREAAAELGRNLGEIARQLAELAKNAPNALRELRAFVDSPAFRAAAGAAIGGRLGGLPGAVVGGAIGATMAPAGITPLDESYLTRSPGLPSARADDFVPLDGGGFPTPFGVVGGQDSRRQAAAATEAVAAAMREAATVRSREASAAASEAKRAAEERIRAEGQAQRQLTDILRKGAEERLRLAERDADLIGLRATAELAQLDELSRIIPEQESQIQDARVAVVRNALEEIAQLENAAAEERAAAAAELAKEQREEFVRSFDGVRQVISQTIGGLLLQQERDWDAFFRSLVASFVSTGVDKVLEQLVNGLAGSSAASGGSGGGGFVGSLLGIVGGLLFAKGGVVSRPTLGVVGEAGPEAVIPLDRLDRMLASQQSGVTVNIIGAPEGTEVKRSKSADGTEQIDAFIGGSMARNMQRGFQRQRFAPGVIGG